MTKCNSYKYKDRNCFEIFCVFCLVCGRWSVGWLKICQWIGGRWVSGGPVGGSVVGCWCSMACQCQAKPLYLLLPNF